MYDTASLLVRCARDSGKQANELYGTHGYELWTSDGTAGGTVMVKDILLGSDGSSPARMIADDVSLFFTADDHAHGEELY